MEIERKFLVNTHHLEYQNILKQIKPLSIAQGYLNTDPLRVVRVMVRDKEGFLTVKGKQVGIAKPEFEFSIPGDSALSMLALCESTIVKDRYEYVVEGIKWEIDVFKGENEGLVIAEVELESENQIIHLPEWVGKEVSTTYVFGNSNLSKRPLSQWSKNEMVEYFATDIRKKAV